MNPQMIQDDDRLCSQPMQRVLSEEMSCLHEEFH